MSWQRNQLGSASIFKYYAAIGADTNLITEGGDACRQIIVGTAGTLVLTRIDGTEITIASEVVTASPVLNVSAVAIKNGSTATKILVLW
jgi:hypothetical protein